MIVGADEKILNKIGALFYADNGLLSGQDAEETQRAMQILTESFARVGLKMDAAKTKGMIMTGGKISSPISPSAYSRKVTGFGFTSRELGSQKQECDLCSELVMQRNMTNHKKTQKCQLATKERTQQNAPTTGNQEPIPAVSTVPTEGIESEMFHLSMPKGGWTECPAQECPFTTRSRSRMRQHFRSRHPQDTIIIGKEGQLPQCPKCGLFQHNVDLSHQATADCRRFTIVWENQKETLIQQAASKTVFTVGDTPIENVDEFKYLGRILAANDQDTAALNHNLQQAQQKWGAIGRILSKKGANL